MGKYMDTNISNKIIDSEPLMDEDGIDVRYICLRNSENKYDHILPPVSSKRYLFGALGNEEELLGILSLSISALGNDTLVLDYIYVREDCRGEGIGTGLIKYATDICVKSQMAMIFCKVIDKDNNLLRMNSLLTGEEFIPTSLEGNLIIYDTEEIESSLFKKAIDGFKDDRNIRRLSDVSPYLIRQVSDDFSFDFGAFDKNLCRIVFVDEKVTGVVLIENRDNAIEVPLLKIMRSNKDKNLLLKLLVTIFREAKALNAKYIRFMTEDPHIEAGFDSCIVYPEIKLGIHEYIRML